MKTETMQKRLESLWANGQIKSGESYNLMPSDCRGDGYDIAISPRCDESGDYVIQGHVMRVECMVRVGSRNWRDGIPAGYSMVCDPAAPYKLQPGEKAVIVHRTGQHIGGSYMSRRLASIAIIREGVGKIYRGHTPYWIDSTNTYAAHYRSGFSRRDQMAYNREVARLQSICDQINATLPAAVAV